MAWSLASSGCKTLPLHRTLSAAIRPPGLTNGRENDSGAGQADQHFEKTTLDKVDLHLRGLHGPVSFFPKTSVQIGFGLGVIASELLDFSIDEPVHKFESSTVRAKSETQQEVDQRRRES
jgi:hypothetical protein